MQEAQEEATAASGPVRKPSTVDSPIFHEGRLRAQPTQPEVYSSKARRFNSLMDAFRALKPDEMIFGIIGPFSAKIREKASLIVYAL